MEYEDVKAGANSKKSRTQGIRDAKSEKELPEKKNLVASKMHKNKSEKKK